MSRPRNNKDNLFVVIGLGVLFIGLKKFIDFDGYNKEIGYWLLVGGALLAAGILDPILAFTGKKKDD